MIKPTVDGRNNKKKLLKNVIFECLQNNFNLYQNVHNSGGLAIHI